MRRVCAVRIGRAATRASPPPEQHRCFVELIFNHISTLSRQIYAFPSNRVSNGCQELLWSKLPLLLFCCSLVHYEGCSMNLIFKYTHAFSKSFHKPNSIFPVHVFSKVAFHKLSWVFVTPSYCEPIIVGINQPTRGRQMNVVALAVLLLNIDTQHIIPRNFWRDKYNNDVNTNWHTFPAPWERGNLERKIKQKMESFISGR